MCVDRCSTARSTPHFTNVASGFSGLVPPLLNPMVAIRQCEKLRSYIYGQMRARNWVQRFDFCRRGGIGESLDEPRGPLLPVAQAASNLHCTSRCTVDVGDQFMLMRSFARIVTGAWVRINPRPKHIFTRKIRASTVAPSRRRHVIPALSCPRSHSPKALRIGSLA